MPQKGCIRIYGQGEIEVERVIQYLADLKQAYGAILMFENAIDNIRRADRDFPYRGYPFAFLMGWPLAPRRSVQTARLWLPGPEEIAAFISVSDELLLSATRLASPGFWEFVGKLNPLEVIRQYLNDRHEWRKDREYRETSERRRLALENLSLENKVLSERVKIAKELGATDRDLAPLLKALVYKPLQALDRHQDDDVIEKAEFIDRNPG